MPKDERSSEDAYAAIGAHGCTEYYPSSSVPLSNDGDVFRIRKYLLASTNEMCVPRGMGVVLPAHFWVDLRNFSNILRIKNLVLSDGFLSGKDARHFHRL